VPLKVSSPRRDFSPLGCCHNDTTSSSATQTTRLVNYRKSFLMMHPIVLHDQHPSLRNTLSLTNASSVLFKRPTPYSSDAPPPSSDAPPSSTSRPVHLARFHSLFYRSNATACTAKAHKRRSTFSPLKWTRALFPVQQPRSDEPDIKLERRLPEVSNSRVHEANPCIFVLGLSSHDYLTIL
jgi:hypothetical protein